jgi:hypothetical protein
VHQLAVVTVWEVETAERARLADRVRDHRARREPHGHARRTQGRGHGPRKPPTAAQTIRLSETLAGCAIHDRFCLEDEGCRTLLLMHITILHAISLQTALR